MEERKFEEEKRIENENKYTNTTAIEFGDSPDFLKKQFDSSVVPDIVKKDDIPEFIKREMKFFIIWNAFSATLSIAILAFLTIRYTLPTLEDNILALLVPLLLLSVFFGYRALTCLISISEIKNDKKLVKAESRVGTTIVPAFLAKGYRKLRLRVTNMNWVAFTTYAIIGTIIFTYQSVIDSNLIWPNFNGFVIINHEWLRSDSWTRSIELFKIVLMSVVFAHIFILLSTRSRLHKIDSFYGYEIISNQEVEQLKANANKRNRRILIISLIVIFFVIWIPFRIIKGRRK